MQHIQQIFIQENVKQEVMHKKPKESGLFNKRGTNMIYCHFK